MKRIFSIIFVMTFILLLGSNAVFAIDSQPSSLAVIIKFGEEPLKDINMAVCRVADAVEKNGGITYIATPEFIGSGADFSNLNKEKNIALAAGLNAYVHANNIGRYSQKTDISGNAAFTDLSAGLYMLAQIDAENSEYIIDPYIVAVPVQNETKNGWNYDVVAYPKTEPVKRDDEVISVSVYKVWAGTGNTPANIFVQLYRNGTSHGNSVTLNAGNGWNHTWTNLNPDDIWTVDELNIPGGFVKSVSGSASTGFIITNTRDTTSSGIPDNPQTSDDSNAQLWITLIVSGIGGLFAAVFVIIFIAGQRKRAGK